MPSFLDVLSIAGVFAILMEQFDAYYARMIFTNRTSKQLRRLADGWRTPQNVIADKFLLWLERDGKRIITVNGRKVWKITICGVTQSPEKRSVEDCMFKRMMMDTHSQLVSLLHPAVPSSLGLQYLRVFQNKIHQRVDTTSTIFHDMIVGCERKTYQHTYTFTPEEDKLEEEWKQVGCTEKESFDFSFELNQIGESRFSREHPCYIEIPTLMLPAE